MKIKTFISKSPDGKCAEVIAEENGRLFTKHIHRSRDNNWIYCAEIVDGQRNLKVIEE